MSVTFDYRGKFVFVAGGTSGINLGVAHAFARCGARVAVLSRSQEKVDAAVAELKRHGGDAVGFSADVRDYAKTEEALKSAHGRFGEIDVLVSGAAGNFPAPALGISSNGFRAVVEIDLLGTFHVLRAAYPLLRKPGASVINISAPQSVLPMETQMHVCAAKAGVDMITRVGALEWGAAGVRVNSVLPGPIEDTEGMARLAPTPELQQATIASVPMHRYGSKQDIANCCLWLGSDAASYVSGALIPVDGGWALGGAASMGSNMKKLLAGD
ncbi:MAG TPA: SDR family oxidoreductase [Solimonas sp.]|nr:SDR family oxidoreductase [Solimonas sp.]